MSAEIDEPKRDPNRAVMPGPNDTDDIELIDGD